MPTEKGLQILESIKAEHFPLFGQRKAQGGKDYRFSRRGQAEFKRAAKLQAIKHREVLS
ncbi:hypothetical protein HB762_10160 [Vibrio campbellii]|uniref:Uncharacterized protein n=1 Tax=Vibrio campbellii TaxID=680 RepID=A0ABY5IBP1_9VIBR|nr:hypothetical protein [Vibrio campbellii]UTZ31730.1 hypothetical protein HB762_10160 [Vibrio campbellii]